ncbi:hypothetical protein Tco_1127408, partial [Tanacetum coccineum]
TKACDDAGKARMETLPGKDYILLPLCPADPLFSQCSKSSPDDGFKPSGDDENKVNKEPRKKGGGPSKEDESNDQEKYDNVNNTNNVNTASDANSTNNVNAVSSTVNAASIEVNVVGTKTSIKLLDDPNMPELEDIVYSDDDEEFGCIYASPQTRRMTKNLEEHGLFSSVQQRTNHKDFQKCLFAWFLSQKEPKKVIHALKDPSWIEAMQEELLQLKLQEVWTLVDLPNGKRPIGTKWVYRNKKEKEAFVIKNKQGLVASRMLSYGKMKREVYVCQPPGFEDPNFPDRRGKIDKTLFIRRNKGLQVKQKKDGIFISQDKYVTEILKKFSFTDVKTAAHYGNSKPLPLKDEDG